MSFYWAIETSGSIFKFPKSALAGAYQLSEAYRLAAPKIRSAGSSRRATTVLFMLICKRRPQASILTVVTDPIGTCADGSIPSLPLAVVENRMCIMVVPGMNHTAGVRPLDPASLPSYVKFHNHREMEKIAPIVKRTERLDVKSHSVVLGNNSSRRVSIRS